MVILTPFPIMIAKIRKFPCIVKSLASLCCKPSVSPCHLAEIIQTNANYVLCVSAVDTKLCE